jgi:hypothetical protein
VFKDALIELMEDVRHDRAIDVDIGEVLPKRIDNWLNTSFCTSLQRASWILVK